MIEALSDLGSLAWGRFWWPVAVWTGLWLVFRGVWMLHKPAHPATRYAVQAAVLAALPIGLVGANVLYGYLPAWWVPPAISDTFWAPATSSAGAAPGAVPPDVTWSFFTSVGLITLFAGLMSVWRLGKLVASSVALRVWFRSVPKYRSAHVQTQVDAVVSRWGLTRPVHVFVAQVPVLPMTFGWRAPVILLPESVLADKVDLRLTLLHELTHVRQNDFLFHLMEQVLGALFVFHPGVHLLQTDLADAREQRCDAAVLDEPHVHHRSYANLLLRLTPVDAFAPVVALTMARSSSQLKTRTLAMKTLVNNPSLRPSAKQLRWYASLWGCALSVCMVLATTTQAQDAGSTFLVGAVPQVETLASGMKIGTVIQGGFDQFIGTTGTINSDGTTARILVDRFYADKIQTNMAAQVRIGSQATCEAVVGEVDRSAKVGADGSAGGRYFTADLTTTCPAGVTIQPDQDIRARVLFDSEADRIQIPRGPFYQQTGGGWVFVVDASGATASRRMVTLGRQNPRSFEVLEGLQPGEKVVVSSYAGYDTAQQIQIQ